MFSTLMGIGISNVIITVSDNNQSGRASDHWFIDQIGRLISWTDVFQITKNILFLLQFYNYKLG